MERYTDSKGGTAMNQQSDQGTSAFLSQLRNERGWTQRQLAEQLSVTDKAVSRWETGRGLPDIQSLKSLSRLFHVTINEILAGQRLEPEERRAAAERNLEEALEQAERQSERQAATQVLMSLLSLLCLLISLKLFYNSGLAADVFQTSPSVLAGGELWNLADWARLFLLAGMTLFSLRGLGK